MIIKFFTRASFLTLAVFVGLAVSLFFIPSSAHAATATVTISPDPIYLGENAIITWSSTGTLRCVGTGFSTGNATSGSVSVTPSTTGVKTYSVTCYVSSPACSLVQTSVTDYSGPSNCANITLSNGSCAPKNATCKISSGNAETGSTTHYQCQGSCTTVSASDTVTVNTPPPPPNPSVDLTVSPTTVTAGSTVLVSWSGADLTDCDGTNFSTNGAASGSVTVTPSANTTYSISCNGTTYATTPGVWVYDGEDLSDLYCPAGNMNNINVYSGLPDCPANPAGKSCNGSGRCKINTVVGCYVYTDLYQCSGGSTPTVVTDSVSVTYNNPPNAPTITGPTSGYISTSYTYTFRASDPNSNSVRYHIDWDNNGTTDQTLPASGYVTSNTQQSTTRSWGSPSTNTFKARTQDSPGGAQSGWTTYVVTISNPTPECSDGANNDGDAYTDYPSDPGCTSAGDTTESPNPQCSDGIDNDSDGRIDLNDYGCTGITDTGETPNPQCSDGVDNNGNGLTDTADTGACSGPTDDSEVVPDASQSLIAPDLISPNTTASITWSVTNVEAGSCTITGTNGESSGALSGTSGTYVSDPLASETTFTLRCTDLNDDFVSESATVKIAPSFDEI